MKQAAAVMCVLALAGFSPAGEVGWQKLPPIPDKEGVAGAYAGVSGGALLVGGGANFPSGKPWEGGEKAWYDAVSVLDRPDGAWRPAGRLPRPAGYGASISTDRGLLCIGGADGQRHYRDCFLLEWGDGKLSTRPMPPLPGDCAYLCAARIGDGVYAAGGSESPASTRALHAFWKLDLARTDKGWQTLPLWPGRPRMLAVAGAQAGAFFLVGGVDLSAGNDGRPIRTYLRDAYRYSPGQGWKRIADLPRPLAAAPSPAPTLGKSRFIILGGDDGTLVNFEPLSAHPGFSAAVMGYDTATDTWARLGQAPFSHVTTPAVIWGEWLVVPSGEVRPGVRSPEVWGSRPRPVP